MLGQIVGNYRIIAKLGEGGMGAVFVAEHPTIGRKAAIKLLHPEVAAKPDVMARFFNEARAANAIRHPGIVEVFDLGTLPDGQPYIAMELLEGESLRARLRRPPAVTTPEALVIAWQVACVLAAAHAAGIVHRDLKPDNLFIASEPGAPLPGLVKVLDFGVAKLTSVPNVDGHNTRTGTVLGTPLYMSPEQCRGTRELDHRSDLYSLGVILFEMLCGRPPFVSEAFGELTYMHMAEPPPAPHTLNPAIPSDIERLVLRLLAKRREDRFPSAAAVAAELARLEPSVAALRIPAPDLEEARAFELPTRPIETRLPATVVEQSDSTLRARAGGPVPARRAGLATWSLAAAVATLGVITVVALRQPRPRPTPATVSEPTATAAAIQLFVTSVPPGADVHKADGTWLGSTPLSMELPRGRERLVLRLRKAGFEPFDATVSLERDVQIAAALQVIAPPPPSQPPKLRSHAKKQEPPPPVRQPREPVEL